ncbi:MAG: tRNA pseudouridine(55) synthase TruB [Ekhidna sp.]|nr:tRNA pseudouridine(55) synthase TruB [Ekhidna sp.]
MRNSYEEGRLLLINKPLNWTSFDVVKKLRNTLKVKKIGHAGTLDPLATGLLLIGTGKFTKKLSELQDLNKTYCGIMEIGKTTPSYDLETVFNSQTEWQHLEKVDFENVKNELTGDIQQVPPDYSAIKVNGERAYKKARANREVKINTRSVLISDFTISTEKLPEIGFKVTCSKGTYIRTLANDFGKKLGVGAYLKKLTRTKVGEYNLSDAFELEDFIDQHYEGN